MKFLSALITAASGSIGGLTASHNRYGKYFRGRVIPVNTNTVMQQTARAALVQFATAWKNLTDPQREAWAAWAAIVQKTDALGASIFLTGFQWYVAINSQRIYNGLAALTSPSAVMGYDTYTAPVVTADTSLQTHSIVFTATDNWHASGGFLSVQLSLPQNATINFFSGPFSKLVTLVSTDTSPKSVAAPATLQTGQKIFYRITGQDPDGRPLVPSIISTIVVA